MIDASQNVRKKKTVFNKMLSQWQLYALLLPGLFCLILFHYVPIYGVSIAFKDLQIGDSLFGGEWVGFKHFEALFTSTKFWTILKNTLTISLVQIIFTWPIPIIFALLVHNCTSKIIRKSTQTFSYMPHLLSTVVVITIIELLTNQETGLINLIANKLGNGTIDFMGESKFFLPLYTLSGVWQGMGSSAVIYIAALSAVDVELIEAATIDGANKLQRIWHIDIPTILPTIITITIINFGKILNVGYEKVLLLQNDLNIDVSEIISTYVYKRGLISTDYSYSAAVSLFNNIVGVILVIVTNRIAKKATDVSLF